MKVRAPNTNIMVSVVSQTKICGTKQKNPPQHMITIVYLRPSRSSAAYAKPIPTIPTKFTQIKQLDTKFSQIVQLYLLKITFSIQV